MWDEPGNVPNATPPDRLAEVPRPVLDYRGVEIYPVFAARPPRKPWSPPFCFGFFASALMLAFGWLTYGPQWRSSAWPGLAVVLTVAVIGAALAAWQPSRRYAPGYLLALGIWLLLFGVCAAVGGV